MHLPIHTASPEALGSWLVIAAFGAYHGLNPAMGWLFALALGLQQNDERAIWRAMAPITAGHAASVAIVAAVILALQAFISLHTLQIFTAGLLLLFGAYKLLNWYRHPRWVGMRVNGFELAGWSFLMATAHGAGLMIAPAILGVTGEMGAMNHMAAAGVNAGLAVVLHTLAMFVVMVVIAWVVYRKLGLMVLRKGWVNFDLIWAAALMVVGVAALFVSM